MRTSRSALVPVGAVAALLLLAGPASAHVTAHSSDATSGGHDAEIAFRVPNEQDSVSTTKVMIVLPADKPFAGVLAAPKAGWKVAVTSSTLTTPISTDDGQVDTAVSTITWTATAGGTGPGQYDDFEITVGQLPTTDRVAFKAIQTYSDGSVVRWIEQSAAGAATEPEHPAPELALGASVGDPSSSATPASTGSAHATPAVTATTPAVASESTDDTGRTLGAVGIGLGALALLVALAALVRSRSSRT